MSLLLLSEDEFEKRMLPSFESIFADTDQDTDKPFSENIRSRGVLYHIEPKLSLNELNALTKAGQLIGDSAAWISILDKTSEIYYPQTRETVLFDKPWSEHWIWEFEDTDNYLRTPDLVLANAHFSPTGQWGMLRYMDGFGFIGGSEIFLHTYYASIGVSEEALCRDFLHDMRLFKVGEEKIFTLFYHLYGEEVARRRVAPEW